MKTGETRPTTWLIGSTFAVGLATLALGATVSGCGAEKDQEVSLATPHRLPVEVPRINAGRATTPEELAKMGLLSAAEAAGKLPGRVVLGYARAEAAPAAPADLVERYRRLDEQWKTLEAATRGLSAEERAVQYDALKKRVILAGRP